MVLETNLKSVKNNKYKKKSLTDLCVCGINANAMNATSRFINHFLIRDMTGRKKRSFPTCAIFLFLEIPLPEHVMLLLSYGRDVDVAFATSGRTRVAEKLPSGVAVVERSEFAVGEKKRF